MKTLFYNCFSGISGDMNLAAMIDLGVPKDYLISELKKLPVEGYHIHVEESIKLGILGTKVTVHLEQESTDHHNHSHGHSHSHGHHHDHQHSHGHEHHHEHHHHHGENRNFSAIKILINNSELNAYVKKTSVDIFYEVAVAEGKIHGKPPEEVHFHEVGAVDSIVDIVGAAICYHYLKPDKVVSTHPELGGGFVKCAHGNFPVPAPATLEILKGVPVTSGKVNTETTTPTGAAILKVLVDEFVEGISGTPEDLAYGIGHKDMEIPNVLRVGILTDTLSMPAQLLYVLEANIDDQTAEDLAVAQEELLGKGALDVWLSAIYMKKNRAAHTLSVLCDGAAKETLRDTIFRETSTLGIREQEIKRYALKREEKVFSSSLGDVRMKEAFLHDQFINVKPEADDLKALAEKHNKPVREIRNIVQYEYTQLIGTSK